MTYGDGLANIDIAAEIAFHADRGRKATVACVRPPARFGRIVTEGSRAISFEEKPQAEGGLINGGFFVLEPERARTDRRYAHGLGEGTDGKPGGRRPTGRVGASRILAADGYACATSSISMRCGTAARRRGSCGKDRRTMVGLVAGCRACGGRLIGDDGRFGDAARVECLPRVDGRRARTRSAIRCAPRCASRANWCRSTIDVAPEELFGNYVYFSSYSDEWLAHAKQYCDMARRRFALDAHSLVVELASNDGYLLKNFVANGHTGAGHRPVRHGRRGRGEDRRADLGGVLRRVDGAEVWHGQVGAPI